MYPSFKQDNNDDDDYDIDIDIEEHMMGKKFCCFKMNGILMYTCKAQYPELKLLASDHWTTLFQAFWMTFQGLQELGEEAITLMFICTVSTKGALCNP